MRRGAWLVVCGLALGLPLLLPACSGGYPLPPTKCDDWCHVTLGAGCKDWYNPTSCVAQCEDANLSDPACSNEFEATLACFRSSPDATTQRCSYSGMSSDCATEVQLLSSCSGSALYY